jgi:hypothetical protein
MPRDPLLLLFTGLRIERSMRWTLEAAGVGSSGLPGHLKAKALLGVYLVALRAWLEDDSEDQSKTLAALDQALGQLERVGAFLRILKNFPCRQRGYAAPQQNV